jgi:uncharacterized protein (TIGR02271 family)
MGTKTATPIQLGWDVFGSDGEKIGTIAAVENNYFIIEKGFIFTEDVFVPTSAISRVEADNVHLYLTKSQVETQDWSAPPVEDIDYAARAADGDVLERREERLTVDKDTEQVGSVRVGKRVVEDTQSVDVPVTREELVIERRAVDRPADDDTLTEDAVEVPVYEEQVRAGKDARVVEELEIGKTAKTGTERVSGTVRREEFEVDADDETLKR